MVVTLAALVGFVYASVGYPGFFGPGVPENLMHLIIGLLFAFFGFSRLDTAAIRHFVGAMGALLLVSKGALLVVNLLRAQSPFGTVTEVLCMVLGGSSILAALYLR